MADVERIADSLHDDMLLNEPDPLQSFNRAASYDSSSAGTAVRVPAHFGRQSVGYLTFDQGEKSEWFSSTEAHHGEVAT